MNVISPQKIDGDSISKARREGSENCGPRLGDGLDKEKLDYYLFRITVHVAGGEASPFFTGAPNAVAGEMGLNLSVYILQERKVTHRHFTGKS